jgi:hypothetical protein
MEELGHGGQSVELSNGLVAVDRQVAKIPDESHLGEHRWAGGIAERRLVDQRAQVILIRQLQRRIVLVEPMNHHFQAASGVEARRPRIGIGQGLRLTRRIMQVRPFGYEEGEIAHRWTIVLN